MSIVVQQTEDTNEIERPDIYIMPLTKYLVANNRFFTDATGQSAMARFKINFPEITIETSTFMSKSNNGIADLVLGYKRSVDKVAMETPLPYTLLPPQYRNLAMVINSRFLTYGVVVYFPLSISTLEGI